MSTSVHAMGRALDWLTPRQLWALVGAVGWALGRLDGFEAVAWLATAAAWDVLAAWVRTRQIDIDAELQAARDSIEQLKERLRQDVEDDLRELSQKVETLTFREAVKTR